MTSDVRPAAPRGGILKDDAATALVLLLGAFAVFKVLSIEFSQGDENVYFYMGKLCAEGSVPYRDFRFAHPPLRLLPPALIFATLGFRYTLLKSLPIAAACATAACLFGFARRAATPLHGLLAAALFLLSTTGVACSSSYMGQETTVAFVAAALLALQRKRPAAAGVLLAAAALVGLYAVCAVAAVCAFLAWSDRRALVRVALGFAAAYGVVTGASFAVGGAAYWRQTFEFHLLKSEDPVIAKSGVLERILLLDPALIALAAVDVLLRRRGFGVHVAVAAAFVAALFAYSSIHVGYATLFVPFLCAPAADALVAIPELLRLPRQFATAVVLLAAGTLAVVGVLRGRAVLTLSARPEIADVARDAEELSAPGDTVFGDPDVAPLVAMLAHRGILARHVDTNIIVYRTGLDDLKSVTAALSKPWPGVLVVRRFRIDATHSLYFGPMIVPEFYAFVGSRFVQARRYVKRDDPREEILLFVQKDARPR